MHATSANGPSAQLPGWIDGRPIDDRLPVYDLAQAALNRRASQLAAGGVHIETFLDHGDAAAAIVRRAGVFGADLVVVGNHGRTGLARTLLGSVAEKVVREAPCAVLVARTGPANGPVVTSTDFSDAAKPGLRAAALEAARTGSPLVGIHVFDLAWPGPTLYAADASGLSAQASDAQALRRATADLHESLADATRGLLVQATGEVLVGDPATVVARRAEELSARAIILATHGRTGLSRMLLGSVAERIARVAGTSVLAVRGVRPS